MHTHICLVLNPFSKFIDFIDFQAVLETQHRSNYYPGRQPERGRSGRWRREQTEVLPAARAGGAGQRDQHEDREERQRGVEGLRLRVVPRRAHGTAGDRADAR